MVILREEGVGDIHTMSKQEAQLPDCVFFSGSLKLCLARFNRVAREERPGKVSD